jgi:hypothetical protein
MAGNGKSSGGVGGGTWLLLLAAIAVLIWFYSSSGGGGLHIESAGLDPLWLFRYQPWLIVLAALEGLLIWGLFILFIWKRTKAVLDTRPRSTFAWLPSDECDPSPASIDRFGRQIAGIPQPVMHWADWRATAVRLEMLSVGEAKVVYVVQVAERMIPSLRAAGGQIDCAELVPLQQLGLRLPVWHAARPVGGQEQIDE